MYRIFLILTVLFFPFFLSAQSWKTFNDTSVAFTASYPPNWTSKINETKRVFFTSPPEGASENFRQNVNVSVKYDESFVNGALKPLMTDIVKGLANNFTNFSKLGERYFEWNKTETCEIIYTCNYDGIDSLIRITQWFAFSKGRMFTITYTAIDGADAMQEKAMKIIKGIKFR